MKLAPELPEQQRLRRYVRHRHGKPTFQMQPRDLQIVKIVSDHRVISSDDIQLLAPGSDQAILRRLQKLFHHGFLDRPRSQRPLGNMPMVYALGQRGAELIANAGGRKPITDWTEKNRQLQGRHLEHALMISRFQVALEHASIADSIKLERWLPDGALRDAIVVGDERGSRRIPIAPDAFFVLNISDASRPGRVHCFLEADRGTMSIARFATKLRGYAEYWQSGRAEQRLGMKNFLVLTIARSQIRAEHLLEAARQVQRCSLRMFVFASETDYVPAPSRRILDPIWRTPSDDSSHSITE